MLSRKRLPRRSLLRSSLGFVMSSRKSPGTKLLVTEITPAVEIETDHSQGENHSQRIHGARRGLRHRSRTNTLFPFRRIDQFGYSRYTL